MEVSRFIMKSGECLHLLPDLVTQPVPGHQEAGQGDEGGQGGQSQQHRGQRDQHQARLPGQARVECREELCGAGDRMCL